jgi:hypothetical protein
MVEGDIDWGLVTQMQENLKELEAKHAEKAKIFNPKQLVKNAKAVRELHDEELGTVRYVLLSYNELNEIIEKHTENKDRSIAFLHKQLAPANPGLTEEDVRAMPYEVVVRLLTKLQTEGSFFQKQKTSPIGSQSTEQPKK